MVVWEEVVLPTCETCHKTIVKQYPQKFNGKVFCSDCCLAHYVRFVWNAERGLDLWGQPLKPKH
jgi:hypothetical protein